MFPAVVNCCTIDWFSEWPAEALLEVARKLLKKDEIGDAELTENIGKMCVTAHQVRTYVRPRPVGSPTTGNNMEVWFWFGEG